MGIEESLNRFWNPESIGIKDDGVNDEEDTTLENFNKTVCVKKGIIEEVLDPEKPKNRPVFYLPHQIVIRKESITTKLRIVFDASAHEIGEFSLNDCLFQGENLNPNIIRLLINFRLFKVAFLADIEKAFLQISLSDKDRDAVRFLVADADGNIKVYKFNRVLFGVKSSPYLLSATIKNHIAKYCQEFPAAVEVLENCFYVDDLIAGKKVLNLHSKFLSEQRKL
ncbi:integrase catalytic domain-containing protein [Trichonephila inaurata madagascariensis]|uniref:Integrase catalytic domain-containing protein n=1 Tax=Trichonephila inaurata madagascariensis TaxID=2747483 RepID=A0A8X7CJM0_9ARAC|nr:integrase catalytic domain-containing protein [Trichonephila inaurata madagascariensis]